MGIIPLPFPDYHWSIGKLAKDFYDTKFGDGTFSANKVKELLTTKHNFNRLFVYTAGQKTSGEERGLGYTICFESDEILHYSYPFYNLQSEIKTAKEV